MSPGSSLRVVANVRAVLADRIVDDAIVVLDGARIDAVVERTRRPVGALDGRGAFAFPGLVDSHSDGLEREMHPRANVQLDAGFALRSFEQRVRSAGILTMAHGVGFQEKASYQRTLALAHRLVDEIATRRSSGASPVEHVVLFRTEARHDGGLESLIPRLGDGQADGRRPLLSFEDHSPGQGQYRDIEVFRSAISRDLLPEGTTVDDVVAERLAEAEAAAALRDRNWSRVSSLARTGTVRLLAHDCEDADEVALAHDGGADVAEFPLGEEAAAEARRRGMHVVMGGPNVLRGGSHSGNVAAEALVRAGLCTVLASDYLPASLLASVFALAHRGAARLPQAAALVTSGPADLLGLGDRGRLVAGARGEVVLVDHDGTWPHVRAVLSPSDLADAVHA
jgi:alpha-D-ribose 1-methylphosphonate 5-triphosphate diphosphatase